MPSSLSTFHLNPSWIHFFPLLYVWSEALGRILRLVGPLKADQEGRWVSVVSSVGGVSLVSASAYLREGLFIIEEGGAWVIIFAEYWGMGLMDMHMYVPVWYRRTYFSQRHITEHPVGSDINSVAC